MLKAISLTIELATRPQKRAFGAQAIPRGLLPPTVRAPAKTAFFFAEPYLSWSPVLFAGGGTDPCGTCWIAGECGSLGQTSPPLCVRGCRIRLQVHVVTQPPALGGFLLLGDRHVVGRSDCEGAHLLARQPMPGQDWSMCNLYSMDGDQGNESCTGLPRLETNAPMSEDPFS